MVIFPQVFQCRLRDNTYCMPFILQIAEIMKCLVYGFFAVNKILNLVDNIIFLFKVVVFFSFLYLINIRSFLFEFFALLFPFRNVLFKAKMFFVLLNLEDKKSVRYLDCNPSSIFVVLGCAFLVSNRSVSQEPFRIVSLAQDIKHFLDVME